MYDYVFGNRNQVKYFSMLYLIYKMNEGLIYVYYVYSYFFNYILNVSSKGLNNRHFP